MYDELVERLHKRIALTTAGSPIQDDLEEAADAIEELQLSVRGYEQLCDAWETLANYLQGKIKDSSRWVPVTEEPPLKVGDDGYNGYLVYANGYYEVADYTTDKFDNVPYFHVNGEYETGVTHFMPLPEPPKEKT